MALPSDLTTITVTGTFTTITGTPLTGQVNFSLTTPVEDSTGKVIFNAFTQSAALNSSGFMSIVLPCTDNADLNPVNFSYLVTEAVPGLGRAYYVQLPHTLGSTVDLSSLAPVATPPATSAFATGNTWTGPQTFAGNPPIRVPGGAVAGDVLTSDVSGNATWQPPAGGLTPPAGDIGGSTSAPTVVGTHLASALPIAQGGTGQGSAAAAYNALSPMTTTGDLEYESGASTASRLPGNTSATKNFLTSTGTGSAATAPAWGTIASGDMPTGTTSARGALQLDGTATDLQPVPGVAAAGSTGKAADAAHIHPWKPWQFPITAYGAKIDGSMITDAAMSSGSHTLTSASGPFTLADVGKHVCVNNAGGDPTRSGSGSNPSGALFTTISAYNSATSVTLTAANASGGNVSGSTAVYGTDDTAAVQSAMNALMTYSGFAGQPYYAELVKDKPGICVLATMPVPGGNLAGGLTYGNAQIPLPVVDVTGTKPKPTVVIRDLSDNSILDFWQQSIPQVGSCFFSMIEITNANHNDPTYGPVSVIGGPTVTAPFTHNYNNVLVIVDGVRVVCPVNPGQIAYDFYFMCQFAWKVSSADVFAGVTGTPAIGVTGSGPTNSNGQGLRVPYTGLNDRCDIDSLSIEGYYYGMSLDEHVAAHRLAIIYTNTGIYIPATGGGQATHGAWVGYASVEICQYCVYVDGGGNSLFGLVIDNLDNEGNVTAHVYDPSNYLTGCIRVLPSQSGALPVTPIVTGAANTEVLSMSQVRGLVTPPNVPLTTVSLQNPFWRHATVMITSGGAAVTVIKVDGTATGLTLGTSGSVTVRVPSGHSISLTYASTAPTWTWVLD